jgi:hypothetical protein
MKELLIKKMKSKKLKIINLEKQGLMKTQILNLSRNLIRLRTKPNKIYLRRRKLITWWI